MRNSQAIPEEYLILIYLLWIINYLMEFHFDLRNYNRKYFLSRVSPSCELLMIVQKPGMHKSVSHNLTLVNCLLEAGIANSKDEVLFLLLSWESSGKCFLNWSRKRTALWRIKLPQKNRYFLKAAEELDLYIFLMFLMKDPKNQS